MLLLYSVVTTLNGMAISLGVGASTFALIFYFIGIHNPALRQTGRIYQRVVYIVLRVAMTLILLTEIAKGIGIFYLQENVGLKELLGASVLMFIWTIVAVLFLNAILMTVHYMPMKLGPAIQATSWYMLGVIVALPMVTFTYLPLMLTYLGCILAFAVLIELITQRVTPKPPPALDTIEA